MDKIDAIMNAAVAGIAALFIVLLFLEYSS